MFVAVIKIELRFHTVLSLKEKRKIVNSVKMKIFNKFKVSIAEVEDQSLYNSSVLGVSFISLQYNHCNSKIQKIINFLENYYSDVFFDYDHLIEEY